MILRLSDLEIILSLKTQGRTLFKSPHAESDGLMIWVSLSQRNADGHLGYHLSLESTELKTYFMFSENLVTMVVAGEHFSSSPETRAWAQCLVRG